MASVSVLGCLACSRTCLKISSTFILQAAEARTNPLFQSNLASASTSSVLTKCSLGGRSYLFATITMGGLLVRRVLKAASAADIEDRRELSVEDETELDIEEQMEEPRDEQLFWWWWWLHTVPERL